MYTKTYSTSLKGIDADLIAVEVDASQGLPGFNIVGLADKSINEAKERITVAMRASEYELHPKRILVNLSPGYIKKEGVHYDLAISVALMVNFGYINCPREFLEEFCFLGELSLTGEVKKISEIIILALSEQITTPYLIIPTNNEAEAPILDKAINNSKKLFFVKNLHDVKELVETLYHLDQLGPEERKISEAIINKFSSFEKIINMAQTQSARSIEDFGQVIGQYLAKRAFELAVAGGHHVLMYGPPGCGKSMLAKRFVTLLSSLNLKQSLETTKIYSLVSATKTIIDQPPFRAPHHSASAASLVGGGAMAKPGEVSLAHNGVLFLDELTEFNRSTIEQLRQILEEKSITINRVKNSLKYPADFVLIAACNPCPCGYYGDVHIACTCTSFQVQRYLAKLSGPLLDRIDIHLHLARLTPEEIRFISKNQQDNYNSLTMRASIARAQEFKEKYNPETLMETDAQEFLDHAIFGLQLSARSHQKIIKLARTIANMAQSIKIKQEHLTEALQFRRVDWQENENNQDRLSRTKKQASSR